MSKKVKRDVGRHCIECRELFYVSERNKRKVFCSAICRERHHSHAKYQQFKAWRECVYEKQASYQKQVSCKGTREL